MNRNIHLLFILLFLYSIVSYAQDNNPDKIITTQSVNGYYQKIDLRDDTPCNCDQKTDRTYELNKGLIEKDVLKYQLHAYKFTLGNSIGSISKLFKAFENDLTLYKVSMKEWESFMLLTTSDFDAASFEKAAVSVFGAFVPIPPLEFLKLKNTSSYNEYFNALEEDKRVKEEYLKSKNITH